MMIQTEEKQALTTEKKEKKTMHQLLKLQINFLQNI